MDHYRHGDLVILRVDAIPAGAIPQQHRILAEGEATGHAHRVDTGILYERDGRLYLDVAAAKASLTHEEHGTIILPTGRYEVRRQREYIAPELTRQVAD